jgi:hypothetical protein
MLIWGPDPTPVDTLATPNVAGGNEPRNEGLKEAIRVRAMRVNDAYAIAALDVLPDQVFKQIGLAAPRRADNVAVLEPRAFGHRDGHAGL